MDFLIILLLNVYNFQKNMVLVDGLLDAIQPLLNVLKKIFLLQYFNQQEKQELMEGIHTVDKNLNGSILYKDMVNSGILVYHLIVITTLICF